MLDAIKKKLGMTSAAEATETVKLVVDTSAVAAELSVMRTDFEAEIAKLIANLAGSEVALTSMTENFEVANVALNAMKAEKAETIAKAEAAKLVSRKQKVVLAIGTEKADGLMLATQGLDDVAFGAVVSALAGSVDAEAKTDAFTESGVEAEADATKAVVENQTAKLIRQKYQRAK